MAFGRPAGRESRSRIAACRGRRARAVRLLSCGSPKFGRGRGRPRARRHDYAPSAVIGEVHDRAAGEDRGQHHVARGFDLLAADALGAFAVAARERFHERSCARAASPADLCAGPGRGAGAASSRRAGARSPRRAARCPSPARSSRGTPCSLRESGRCSSRRRAGSPRGRLRRSVRSCCVLTLPAAMRAAAGSSMSRSSKTSWMSFSVTGIDPVAAARDRAHEAVVGELGQRDAHAGLAELVLAAELRLRDLAPGRDRATDDVAADALVRALGEERNGDAHA